MASSSCHERQFDFDVLINHAKEIRLSEQIISGGLSGFELDDMKLPNAKAAIDFEKQENMKV